MDGWITFWKITIVGALAVYFAVAVFAAVVGMRDMLNLVHGRVQVEDDEPSPTESA